MGTRRKNIVNESQSTDFWHEREVVSLEEAKSLFLNDIRGLAKQTQRWHRENLTSLEKVLLSQGITVEDISLLTTSLLKNKYVFYMLEELGLKTNTINGRIRTLKSFGAFLHKQGYIERNFSLDLPLIRGEKVVIQTFSEEQIKQLLSQPDRRTFTGVRDYTLLLLLLETGIRISECVNITLDDIRMKDGQILVHGKGSKQRMVPFQRKFRNILNDYLKIRGQVQSRALFVTVDGKGISKRHAQDLIQRYGEQARIHDVRVSPHTFRHTMEKFYILAGGDIFSLQRILGHSTMETVRIYVQMFSTDVQTQHRKFSYPENNL